MEEEEKTLQRKSSDACGECAWLLPGLVVRIMNASLAEGRYYKRKAAVLSIDAAHVPAVAEVEVLDRAYQGDILRVPESELETVVPKPGSQDAAAVGGCQGCA